MELSGPMHRARAQWQELTCRSAQLTGIEAGERTLTCELQNNTEDPNGGKEFRIASITT